MELLTFSNRRTTAPARNVADFLAHFSTVAPAVGQGCHALPDETGGCRGWVQFIIESDRMVKIHRLWTLRPGEGHGSAILRAVCAAADRCGVEIVLKALPFGRKPYPAARDRLVEWYQRHGFAGTHKKMLRQPKPLPLPL